MKRFLAFCLLFTLAVSLSGCIIIPIHKNFDDIDEDKVTSVQIYDLRGESTEGKLPEDAVPVYTVPEDQKEAFFDDLAEIEFTDHIIIVLAAVDPSFSLGDWVVRINYEDGGYALLGDGGYNIIYNADSEKTDSDHYNCDNAEWEEFLFKYLPDALEAAPTES